MSSFELRAIDRNKLTDSIVDQIVDGIRSGSFPAGTAIPAERTLAAQLGVSRSSVREAIRVLEHAGVLDVRTGSGTYVTEASLSQAVMLRAHAALAGDESPLDVIVARRGLEPVAAEIAAINRTRNDIETLRRALADHAAALEQDQDPEDVDFSFHLALAASSHNPVIYMLVERVVELMRQQTWRHLKYRSRERAGAGIFLEQHRAILRAVERSNAAEAAAAMRAHIDSIESGLLAEVSEE
ncbi:MAG TPA: FadR/GntR family transcriptional regulator [Baekduia sp.]|uniref:FadR/GntR family transcriptional regulator n=1 Tax=Baekduia sp. TaxID=2600305 RepID=UPI002D786964|nr:FadR/GntR family transcriptional regulator [Baekduia sp.]HET6507964.1 FadR/GntR family transcriptional regulator [Baekduia sp.]